MNHSLSLSLHGWRGIGPDIEPDLFVWRYRLGFLTLTVCRVCVRTAYREAKAEAARLRSAIASAINATEGRKSR